MKTVIDVLHKVQELQEDAEKHMDTLLEQDIYCLSAREQQGVLDTFNLLERILKKEVSINLDPEYNPYKAQYIVEEGSGCPKCGDNAAVESEGQPEVDENCITLPMVCCDCGEQWTEYYYLSKIRQYKEK